MKRIASALLLLSSIAITSAANAQENTAKEYGKNLITVTPIGLTNRGVALGMSYERAIDEKGILHFSMPVFLTFNSVDENYYDENKPPLFVHAYPGIKIFPTGAFGIVRYGIGPSFVIEGGKTNDAYWAYDPITNTSQYVEQDVNHFTFGVMVTNSLNINFNPKFYFGTELGLGLSYLNVEDGVRQGTEGLVRLGLSFGYRF